MRMSALFLRTLRDDPADAEVDSHRLLVRAGYIRRVAAGIYSWLPLGNRVLRKVEEIVREEMDRGRRPGGRCSRSPSRSSCGSAAAATRTYGALMFRLHDRKETGYCLSPTAEEVVTTIVAQEYGSLPRPAGEPVPDQLEVPRRAPAPLRAAARPRVPDEGRVLVRRRRRGAARELPADVRRVPPRVRAVRAHVPPGRGAVGRDGRRREPRVHGRRRGRRGRLRVVQELRLRRQRRSRAARRAERPRRRADAGRRRRRWRRCTRPTCPGIAGVAEVPRRRAEHAVEVHRVRRRRRARARARARRPRGQRVSRSRPRSRRRRCGCSPTTTSTRIPSSRRATSARTSRASAWSSPIRRSRAPIGVGHGRERARPPRAQRGARPRLRRRRLGRPRARSCPATRARVAASRSRSTAASRSGTCSSSARSTPRRSTRTTPTSTASSTRW